MNSYECECWALVEWYLTGENSANNCDKNISCASLRVLGRSIIPVRHFGGGMKFSLLASSNYFYSIIWGSHWDNVKQPTALDPQSFQKVIVACSGNECKWSLLAFCKQNILKYEGQEVTWGMVMRYCAQLCNCILTVDSDLLEGSCAMVTLSEQREDSDWLEGCKGVQTGVRFRWQLVISEFLLEALPLCVTSLL